jgi:MFS family permease
MLAYSLMMAGTALVVLIAGIIGVDFAPEPGLATLPVALAIIGVAGSTLPTGWCLVRWGRRRVFVAYGVLAIAAALFSAWSLVQDSFPAYCAGAFMLGWAAAAGHQYRFAALEQVPAELAPKATSVLLLGGIIGAFIGPEIAVRGRSLVETPYAGSYLLLACAYLAGVFLVSMTPDSRVESKELQLPRRPTREVLFSPVVMLAISSAAMAYGVMSFLMTATPISMHQHAGHSLEATKVVIQSHIIAMYLPSLVFASLLARLGFRKLLIAGVVALFGCMLAALGGTALSNYWLSMVLLGVGWNFLFLGGTNLLVYGYRASERFRVQAVNDFMVFGVQATVAVGSGWVLSRLGWYGLVLVTLPMLALFTMALWRSRAFAVISARSGQGRPPEMPDHA